MRETAREGISTRASLLVRLRDWDDNDAWSEFSELYSGLIRRVAKRAGLGDTECDDVVQETMLRLSKNIKDFKYNPSRGTFRAWLLRAVKWRIADYYRQQGKVPIKLRQTPENADRRTSTMERIQDPNQLDLAQVLDEEWESDVLRMAVEQTRKRVKLKHFQIFDLYVNKSMPPREVAKMVGVATGQVYLVKYRVFRVFKRCLLYTSPSPRD